MTKQILKNKLGLTIIIAAVACAISGWEFVTVAFIIMGLIIATLEEI